MNDPNWELIGKTLDGERGIWWREDTQQLFIEGENDE